jgi:hypothetical protein
MTQPVTRLTTGLGVMTDGGPVLPFDAPPGLAQQAYTFQFKLVDGVTGQFKRFLTPKVDTVPQLSHDSTRTIKRQVSLQLAVSDTSAVDVIRDRVFISMVLSDGTTYPLGKYTFSTNQKSLSTGGRQSTPTLMDEELIIDENTVSAFPPSDLTERTATIQKNIASFGTVISIPVNCNNLAHVLLSLYGLTGVIEVSPFYTTATWSFGTSGLSILSDVATFGDFFPPWMGNDGLLHMIRTFDPALAVPDFDWDAYPHVYADTITEEDDLLAAPNRFIVVSNTAASNQDTTSTNPDGSTLPTQATNLTIIGTYDVPVNAPHSIKNRGFVVSQVSNLQLDAQDQAIAVARTIGIQSTIYQRTTLTTFPDPRHDSYNVIRWQGQNWLELAWSMDLVAGGQMQHTLRRTYT